MASLLVQYSIYKSHVHASISLVSFPSKKKNKVASVFSTSKCWRHIQNVVAQCFQQQQKSFFLIKKKEKKRKKYVDVSCCPFFLLHD